MNIVLPRCDATSDTLGLVQLSGVWHPDDTTAQTLAHSEAAAIDVASDGRIDNRTALCRALGLHVSSSDHCLITEAYSRWGTAALQQLVGDFAIALRDKRQGRLILARDPFGTRPLFWARTGDGVAWSSDSAELARLTDASVHLTDQYVAGFLTGTEDPTFTPYRGVNVVPPGACVRFEGDQVAIDDGWRPDELRTIRLSDDREYEAAFLELLCDSVHARLANTSHAFAELSGGLDSSSIVSVAGLLVAIGQLLPGSVTTVTYTYPDSPTSREKRYSSIVEVTSGFSRLEIVERDVFGPLFSGIKTALPNPLAIFEATYGDLAAALKATGAAAVLSGQGGDHMMMHAARRAPRLADYAKRGQVGLVASELRGFRSQWNLAYAEIAWNSVIWPMLPNWIKPRFGGRRATLPTMFDSRFVERSGLRERWVLCHSDGGYTTHDGRWQHSLLSEAIATASACHHRELLQANLTYPYLHRPLVEFLMSIPSTQKMRPTQMRSIQRRSLTGILPDLVRDRTSKAGIGAVIAQALVRHWRAVGSLASDMRLYDLGFLDRVNFVRELTMAKHGITHFMQPLTRALVLESWLRSHAG